jgi:3-dehydroquinate synthetase
VERIEKVFTRAGLPVRTTSGAADRKKLFAAMLLDKKVSGGEVKFVLAQKIGRVVWGQKVPAKLIEAVLE